MIFNSFSYVPTPSTLVWTGSVNGTWDANTTANFSGIPSGNFSDGDLVTFNDTGLRTAITVAASGVAPGSVVFSNTTAKDYSVSGGPIEGETSLVVSGGGHVTLGSVNTYTGGTIVTDGTLEIVGAEALPAGGNLSITGGTVVLVSGLGRAVELGGLSIAIGGGRAGSPDGSSTATAAAVPEPSTLLLLGVAAVGLLGCAGCRWRFTG